MTFSVSGIAVVFVSVASCIYITFIAQSKSKNADFLIAAFLCALYFSNHIYPYFDSNMKGFLALATFVVAIGSIVGGVSSVLIPKISSGICVGVFVALFLSSVFCGSDTATERGATVSAIFVVAISLGVVSVQKFEEFFCEVKVCLAGALFLVLAIDLSFSQIYVNGSSFFTTLRNSNSLGPNTAGPEGTWYLIGWAAAAVVIGMIRSYMSGDLYKWTNFATGGYYRLPGSDDQPQGATKKGRRSAPQRTFSYPDTLEFNYFDPDSLPRPVQLYADQIFSAVQALSAEIGFQVDNSRNQAEHLLMMLSNECKRGENVTEQVPPSRLHNKMFANYRTWCKSLGTTPNFTPVESERSHLAKIDDMLVFLLVWGESANLKHMPECLCYLYHKTMHDHLSLVAKRNYAVHNVNFYPGYFLDMVVSPIYDVVASAVKSKVDHANRKTYDDFNEFFWSPDCLHYAHHHALADWAADDSSCAPNQGKIDDGTKTLAEALENATKTYLEKRSWLHPLLSFHRVFEWHVLTFTLLASFAFYNALVWRVSYFLVVASFVFWEISFMGLLWTCLEVWTHYPTSALSGPAIYGYLLRLLAGYTVLVYQTIYYHWAFRMDESPEGSMRALGDSNFWWWQYIWLSFFALVLYFIESILCWIPQVYSFVMTWNSDVVQALLNILYPFSQLYVGKSIHTNESETLVYITFWISLISFKLWFGYRYIIFPISVPTIQLYDDYMNFPDVGFTKTAVLMFIWWFPHFMVYLIDMSIWFSVWSSFVGGFRALIDRQGAVRTCENMRDHFMRLPFAFSQKLLPTKQKANYARAASRASTIGLPKKDEPRPAATEQPKQAHHRAKSSNQLQDLYQFSTGVDNEFDCVEVTEGTKSAPSTQLVMEEFLDARSKRWVNFAYVWNEIIMKLREGDLLSNSEKDILIFTEFSWLSKPVYLPLYQTAGRLEAAIYDYKNAAENYHNGDNDPAKKILIAQQLKETLDIPTWEAVTEAWELVRWVMMTMMGPVHTGDIQNVLTSLYNWANTDDIYNLMSLNNLPGIATSICNIVASLKGVMKSRGKSPVVSVEVAKRYSERTAKDAASGKKREARASDPSGFKRSISTGFLAAITEGPGKTARVDDDGEESTPSPRYAPVMPFRNDGGVEDRVRDKIREDLRNIFNTLKDALRKGGNGCHSHTAPQSQNLIDRITFILSMEKGFLWDDVYASRQIDELAQDTRMLPVLNKINGLFKLRQVQVEPSSSEARRRLHFFVNSLFMMMPSIPSMVDCKEYSCLTPFYSEDVLLTRDDLEQKNSDGVGTLLYLQTLYKKDWHNFLERRGLADEQLIWSSKHLQATRMWASMRAQTLFRTVEGMMFSEAAIKLLGELEDLGEDVVNALTKLKFSYVVAAQAYANMKKSGDHKADDIDFLLARHPNLRVAYIETVRPTRNEQVSFYSVLIKHDIDASVAASRDVFSTGAALSRQKHHNQVKEVYRIKLPGNPILGEGKPENQNHAIIFTRGRYLQAIDMNQAGYFEESLKMRNILEEFDLMGCKILGFREHIFTGSVSSVANYMALQELSFVTLGQRVLTNPLCIRQHYGHPDLFDKLFVMCEGGMSKASRGINLSEDVFAGFNATIRGHRVAFKEYVQVGKGRDVGLQQTYKFEAKLSQGNAEQSISRDMNRICARLDFFRLMSFYYGGIGHYIANTTVMFTLVLVVYTMTGCAIFNQEGVNGRKVKPEGILQIALAGMGILQTLPLCATLAIEKGFFSMATEIVYMIVSGGPLYFIFHIQTKSFYFQQTLLAGGAMYRPTGRGFVTRHSSFDENFRFFASSHIYLGVEIMMALIFYGVYSDTKQYLGLTWSLWLVVISFLLGPFWFNPLSFESAKVLEDYSAWTQWMSELGGRSEQSWSTWWNEENAYIKHLSLSWKLCLVFSKCALWTAVGIGLLGKRFVLSPREQLKMVKIFGILVCYLIGKYALHKFENNFGYAVRRLLHYCVSVACIVPLLLLFVQHIRYFRYTVALYYVASSLAYVLLLMGFNSVVMPLYKVHDMLVGHMIFFVLLMMSILQIGVLQTWLLYHNALSTGVVIEDILKYARKSRERADDEGEVSVAELRAQLAHQDHMIQLLVKANPSVVEKDSGPTKKPQKSSPHGSGSEAIPILSKSPPSSRDGILQSSSGDKRNYGSLISESAQHQDGRGSHETTEKISRSSSLRSEASAQSVPLAHSQPCNSGPSIQFQLSDDDLRPPVLSPAVSADGFVFSQPSRLPPR